MKPTALLVIGIIRNTDDTNILIVFEEPKTKTNLQ